MKKVIVTAVVVASCIGASTANATTTRNRPYYVDELKVGNLIESHGFRYGGRHIAVDSAFCSGLRRYGVRTSPYGLDRFWRFKCDADAANGNFYSLSIKTTRRNSRWYWTVLSAKYEF